MMLGTLRRRLLLAACFTCVAVLFGAACKSPEVAPGTPDDGSLASVFVTNAVRRAVADATFNVFREDGFLLASSMSGDLTFDRKGTKWDTLAYGGWFEDVWVRARVSVTPYDVGIYRLSCKVYRVNGRGDPAMEEEKILTRGNAEYYQGLLAKVKTRIDTATIAVPPPVR